LDNQIVELKEDFLSMKDNELICNYSPTHDNGVPIDTYITELSKRCHFISGFFPGFKHVSLCDFTDRNGEKRFYSFIEQEEEVETRPTLKHPFAPKQLVRSYSTQPFQEVNFNGELDRYAFAIASSVANLTVLSPSSTDNLHISSSWAGVCSVSCDTLQSEGLELEIDGESIHSEQVTSFVIPLMTKTVSDVAFISDLLTNHEYNFIDERSSFKRDDIVARITAPSTNSQEKENLEELKTYLGGGLNPNVFITSPYERIRNAVSITVPIGRKESEDYQRYGLTVSSLVTDGLATSFRRALRASFLLERIFGYNQFPLFQGLSF